MRIEPTSLNPLQALIDSIPDEGILVTKQVLGVVAQYLNKGGIICENYDEAFSALELLSVEEYNILSLEKNPLNQKHILKKVKHG